MFRTLLLGLCALALSAQPKADLVLRNGKVVTLDPAHPEVQALAVRNGRIAALGSNAQMAAWTGPQTKVIDLAGKLAIPGLIEGHGHFMGVGEAQRSLNLRNARSWDDIVAMVAAAAKTAPPGAWILGRGFHQSKWDKAPQPNVQGFPVQTELSKVSPANPVWLTHASGHASMVNQAALKQAEITAKTPDPAGGEILKDAQGEPTGLLQEKAQELFAPAYRAYLSKRTPAEAEADARQVVALATREAIANGITTFEDAGSGLETVDLLKRMADAGQLDLRLWVMLREPNTRLAAHLRQYRIQDAGNGHLTVRAIKRAIDGALGSRGAWLLQPYSDLPSSSGINTEDPADIRVTAELAIQNGFQLCIHAIGDRANREVLNLYQSVFQEHPDQKNLRWRIEHAQHLNPADIPRFGKWASSRRCKGCTAPPMRPM